MGGMNHEAPSRTLIHLNFPQTLREGPHTRACTRRRLRPTQGGQRPRACSEQTQRIKAHADDVLLANLPRRAPIIAINGLRNRIAGAPAVPHCEITVGSRRTGCSNSHRFYSSPAVPRFGCSLLLSFCVSRFTVNKKAQSPAKRYSIRVRFARVSCPWLRLSDTTVRTCNRFE